MTFKEKLSNNAAMSMTKFFRFFADAFFAKRYGHRAVVLETIAGVPGMVGGMLLHMRSLRKMERGNGTMIQELLDEAVNERKHLMFFIEVAQPNWFERGLIVVAQAIFFVFYTFMYIFFTRTAHKMIAYFEEEAVRSYTTYLDMIKSKQIPNTPAPQIAIEYYGLMKGAKLSHMVEAIRADEAKHAEANHKFAKYIDNKKESK
jgi:ubiquinol oxidase